MIPSSLKDLFSSLFPSCAWSIDYRQRKAVGEAVESFRIREPFLRKEEEERLRIVAKCEEIVAREERLRAEGKSQPAEVRSPEPPAPPRPVADRGVRYSISNIRIPSGPDFFTELARVRAAHLPPDLKAKQPTFSAIVAKEVRDRFAGCAPAVYRAAHLSRQAYSAIVSDGNHAVTKRTALSFAFALHLDLFEANKLLEAAGYAFSPVLLEDVICRTCICEKIYDLDKVNEFLVQYELKPL